MKSPASYIRRGLVAVGIACLLLISPLNVGLYSVQKQGWDAFSAESAASPELLQTSEIDLDQDDVLECVNLENGKMQIFHCADPERKPLWQSPDDWKISGWVISDLNHDQNPELTLIVWRKFAPWPIDKVLPSAGRISSFHDKNGMSCHLILIGWRKGEYREVWAGSALFQPVLSLAAADVNGDGAQELVTVEGSYKQPAWDRNGPLSFWKWNGFGFSLLSRVEGSFRQVALLKNSPRWVIASQ